MCESCLLCFPLPCSAPTLLVPPLLLQVNLAELQGEGKLEREGVRPQFPNKNPPELGVCRPRQQGEPAVDD